MKGQFPIEKFKSLRTPFYYYDAELLRDTLRTIQGEVGRHANFFVHYAVKANANSILLKMIRQAGMGADCVSGGEIQAAIAAGFSPGDIVFAGVGKSDWEIILGLERGISCFNVESMAELEVINQLAGQLNTTARVALRINPEIGAHTHAHITTGLAESKFGIAIRDMEAVIERTLSMEHVRFAGLHFHIGSQILDLGDFHSLCNRINDLQLQLEQRHIMVESINVGGGLGIDYLHPNRVRMADFKNYFGTFARRLHLRPQQSLHFELGRAVVAPCGSLITRVLYIKQGVTKRFCIVDAGMTDLIRPALYQAYHKIENLSSNEPMETYDVVGPVCESSDVFAKHIDLNCCRRGDFIAIRSVGAYGEVMASGYNSRPLPQAYISDDL
ncbi:MAG: diaminopimelate decarboxylase [Prevotella sp.]|nr:diaminopimelate decarboxylase [Prevotella sp.]